MAGQADRTASINKQIEAANKRHKEALEKQSRRLLPDIDHAYASQVTLWIELVADSLVTRVASALYDYQVERCKRALAGKTVSGPQQDGRLLDEDAIQEVLSCPQHNHSIVAGQYFEIASVVFSALVNQRLTAATERGLIPPCHYDGWEIYILPSKDAKADPS